MGESGPWLELESDPGLFTLLVGDFGVKDVQVEEIYDLSKPLDQSIYGFIFLFKWTERRSRRRAISEPIKNYVTDSEFVNKMFFAHQVIPNSCATHALLSILLNCGDNVEIGSLLKEFQTNCQGLTPEQKGAAIGNQPRLYKAHNSYAKPEVNHKIKSSSSSSSITLSSSSSSNNSEVFHFICFVPINGHLYELDGLQRYPIDHGLIDTNKNWTDKFKQIIIERLESHKNSNNYRNSSLNSSSYLSGNTNNYYYHHHYHRDQHVNNNNTSSNSSNTAACTSSTSSSSSSSGNLNNTNNSYQQTNGYYSSYSNSSYNNVNTNNNHDIRFNLMALVPDKLKQYENNLNQLNINKNLIEKVLIDDDTTTVQTTTTTTTTPSSNNKRQTRNTATTTTTNTQNGGGCLYKLKFFDSSTTTKNDNNFTYLNKNYNLDEINFVNEIELINVNSELNTTTTTSNNSDINATTTQNSEDSSSNTTNHNNNNTDTTPVVAVDSTIALLTISDLNMILKKIESDIQSNELKIKEELEKRQKYKIDAMRRKHKYDEFIVTYLYMLLEYGKLTKLIQSQIINNYHNTTTTPATTTVNAKTTTTNTTATTTNTSKKRNHSLTHNNNNNNNNNNSSRKVKKR